MAATQDHRHRQPQRHHHAHDHAHDARPTPAIDTEHARDRSTSSADDDGARSDARAVHQRRADPRRRVDIKSSLNLSFGSVSVSRPQRTSSTSTSSSARYSSASYLVDSTNDPSQRVVESSRRTSSAEHEEADGTIAWSVQADHDDSDSSWSSASESSTRLRHTRRVGSGGGSGRSRRGRGGRRHHHGSASAALDAVDYTNAIAPDDDVEADGDGDVDDRDDDDDDGGDEENEIYRNFLRVLHEPLAFDSNYFGADEDDDDPNEDPDWEQVVAEEAKLVDIDWAPADLRYLDHRVPLASLSDDIGPSGLSLGFSDDMAAMLQHLVAEHWRLLQESSLIAHASSLLPQQQQQQQHDVLPAIYSLAYELAHLSLADRGIVETVVSEAQAAVAAFAPTTASIPTQQQQQQHEASDQHHSNAATTSTASSASSSTSTTAALAPTSASQNTVGSGTSSNVQDEAECQRQPMQAAESAAAGGDEELAPTAQAGDSDQSALQELAIMSAHAVPANTVTARAVQARVVYKPRMVAMLKGDVVVHVNRLPKQKKRLPPIPSVHQFEWVVAALEHRAPLNTVIGRAVPNPLEPLRAIWVMLRKRSLASAATASSSASSASSTATAPVSTTGPSSREQQPLSARFLKEEDELLAMLFERFGHLREGPSRFLRRYFPHRSKMQVLARLRSAYSAYRANAMLLATPGPLPRYALGYRAQFDGTECRLLRRACLIARGDWEFAALHFLPHRGAAHLRYFQDQINRELARRNNTRPLATPRRSKRSLARDSRIARRGNSNSSNSSGGGSNNLASGHPHAHLANGLYDEHEFEQEELPDSESDSNEMSEEDLSDSEDEDFDDYDLEDEDDDDDNDDRIEEEGIIRFYDSLADMEHDTLLSSDEEQSDGESHHQQQRHAAHQRSSVPMPPRGSGSSISFGDEVMDTYEMEDESDESDGEEREAPRRPPAHTGPTSRKRMRSPEPEERSSSSSSTPAKRQRVSSVAR